MSLHKLKYITTLPVSIENAWDYFSSPANLSKITPPEMNFNVRTDFKPGDKIYKGMLIDYKVSPLLGIPLSWQTKITEADAPNFFIDEQLKGPYSYWHHEHHFKKTDEGVEMTDVVEWRVPFGFLGDILNSILIQKKVEAIFVFRESKMKEIFSEK